MDIALRLAQLIARYAGTWLFALALKWHFINTISLDDETSVTNWLAAGLCALILFAADHVLHMVQQPPATPKVFNSFIPLLLLGLLPLFSGCNSVSEAGSAAGTAISAAGTAISTALLAHIDGASLTYDPVTGAFGVHVNVKDPHKIARAQRQADALNAASPAEQCRARTLIDQANYIASAKARDRVEKATDKQQLKAFKERAKACTFTPAPPLAEYVPIDTTPPIVLQPVELLPEPGTPPPPSINRVLLIGDNFPNTSSELHECINDVHRDADGFQKYYGIKLAETRYLLNEECTAANMKTNISWAFDNMHPGDKRIVCISGHGAEDVDPNTETVTDIVVTYDMVSTGRWDDSTEISPDFWKATLSKIPPGCNAFIKLDVCHAGGAIKKLLDTGRTARSIDGPAYVQARIAQAKNRQSFRDSVANYNVSFIAACSAGQLSEETSTTGGAATYYFWQAVAEKGPATSTANLTSYSKQLLKANAFTQTPECKGLGITKPVCQ